MTLTVLLACLAMAIQDVFGVLLVIAEARGRALLAGTLDAGFDGAKMLTTVFGAGEIILHGFTMKAMVILAGIMLTSFCTTTLITKWGRRMKDNKQG